jgi:hypothetical protein
VRAILPFVRAKVMGLRRLEFGTSIILSSNMSDLCTHSASHGKRYRATVTNQWLSRRNFTLTFNNITSAWLRCRKFRILDEHIKQSTFLSGVKQLASLTFKNR